MTVVVDANVVVVLVLPLPYLERASHVIETWKRGATEIHAPLLLEYEVTFARQ